MKIPTSIIKQVLYALAFIYLCIQFFGLRNTNHDDIFLHLTSFVYKNNYFDFAKYAAYAHYRVQAYINMPLLLWVDSLNDSIWYDLCNIGIFFLLIYFLIKYISHLSSKDLAKSFLIFFSLLYPLHYYFTFPQSYPVMAAWPILFLFISFDLYLKPNKKNNLAKITSVLLFTLSLLGPEYNLILHPLLLIFTAYLFKQKIKSLTPYAVGSASYAIIYFAFANHAKQSALDTVGRMSLHANLNDLITTFFILISKSFLPIALISGIKFGDARILGGIDVPELITYSNLSSYSFNIAGLTLGILFFIIFLFIFQTQELRFSHALRILIFAIIFCIIPNAVVSGSSHYQEIVMRGYIQGHLVSFYSLVGFSLLFFSAFCLILNIRKFLKIRAFLVVACSIVCSYFSILTYNYNFLNRETMHVNSGKWKAVTMLSEYIHKKRPDLKNLSFQSDPLWIPIGVSSIPEQSPFTRKKYWDDYTEKVLEKPLSFASQSEQGDMLLEIKINSDGLPLLMIKKNTSNEISEKHILLSMNPVSLIKANDRNENVLVSKSDWSCDKICELNTEKITSLSNLTVIEK